MNDSRPWWLWPNLLAFDAPAVAVVWQVFLASAAGVAVPGAATAALALVVWGVYLTDRALDARCGAAGTDRHRAAGRNPTATALAAGAALATAAALALVRLPRAYLAAGLGIAAVTLGYFLAVHVVRTRRAPGYGRGAKELAVGFVFAAGVAIPLFAARPCARWLPGAVAFAGLCWLNCTLISRWEDGPATGPPRGCALVAGCLALAAAGGAPATVAGAVAASTAALAVLHALRALVSVRARRVLADAALLTPLAAVWL